MLRRMITTADLRPAMGEIKADTIITLHVIVRPAGAGKTQGMLRWELLLKCTWQEHTVVTFQSSKFKHSCLHCVSLARHE